jgi:hypothetical protein
VPARRALLFVGGVLLGRRLLLGIIGGLLVLSAPSRPAAASDSYSWGAYGADYGRARTSVIPDAAAASDSLTETPWVVPDPNPGDESQSTPVVVGRRIFFFAFADQTHGALYESGLGASGPGAAREVVSFSASRGESFTSPGDPSVSPDGQWLAFAAGYHLYWWRLGVWGSTYEATIPNAPGVYLAFVSSAPIFVRDVPQSGGWDVCSGSGNGGFACFALRGVESVAGTMPPYTTAGSPITSSAVVVSDSQVCFGVAAAAPRARVVCLDPHGSGVRDGLGAGVVRQPIDAALAYALGSLYVTDRTGEAYRIDPSSGAVEAEQTATSDGAASIAPPAVDANTGAVYVISDGYTAVCALDAADLGFLGSEARSCFPGDSFPGDSFPGGSLPAVAGDLTAATATPVFQGGSACDLVWDATDGGVLAAIRVCGTLGLSMAFSAPDDASAGHNFSAVVAGVGPGSRFLVLWSDAAVTHWSAVAGFDRFVGPHGASGGGLEVWEVRPPLTAWFEDNPAVGPAGGGVPQGGECLLALARPGEFATLSAALPDGQVVRLRTDGTASGNVGAGTGPLFAGPPGGCPAPAAAATYWQDLNAQWNASGPNGPYPGMVDRNGTPPSDFGDYQVWWAPGVAVPGEAGAWPAVVRGTAADGTSLSVSPVLRTQCSAGDRESGDGTCVRVPPPAVCPPGTSLAGLPRPADGNCDPTAGSVPRHPWRPVLICGGPVVCSGLPGSEQPGAVIPEPCDPMAPPGDPSGCPGGETYSPRQRGG